MNKIIVTIIVLIFGVKAGIEQATADSASNVAYASMFKNEAPKPAPKPDPDGDAGKKVVKSEACDCVDCKCDPCTCAPAEWKWNAATGEYRKVKGATVIETRKYKRVAVTTCTKRGCFITEYKWVPVQ